MNRNYYLTIIIISLFFIWKTKDKQQVIELHAHENSPRKLLCLPIDTLATEVIKHHAYSLAYSEEHEQASWVQYKLYKSNLELPQVLRRNSFKEDAKVSTGSASLNDYIKSGYDRGHLAPCADFTFNEQTMLESFYMSNISPQLPSFNRGKWKVLESRVREFAFQYDSLLIITGPVLYSLKNNLKIGDNEVTIPASYFKIVINLKEFNTVSYLMPNTSIEDAIGNYIVSIDSIETATKIDFLYPDSICDVCNEEKLINKDF